MTTIAQEMTIRRLERLANLSERIVADIQPVLELLHVQCDYLLRAAEVMRQQVDDLRDEEEIERLAGGPVRRTA